MIKNDVFIIIKNDVFIKEKLKNIEKHKEENLTVILLHRNIQVITIIVLRIHFIMDIVHVPIKHMYN